MTQEDEPNLPSTIRTWSRDDIPVERRLDFAVVAGDIDTLFEAYRLKIEREWPDALRSLGGLQVYLATTMLVARASYGAARLLCADKTAENPKHLEFVTAAGPIVRTILDSVSTLIFIFEDPERRWREFEQSGWREDYEGLVRLQKAYGDKSEWTEWLKGKQELTDWLRNQAGIDVAVRPASVKWFPTPGGMAKSATDPARKARLQYLNDWIYKELSAEAHLSLTGAIKRGAPLLNIGNNHDSLHKVRSDSVFTAVVLVLCLFSEVVIALHLDHRQKLVQVWATIANYWGPAEELYGNFYSQLLTAAPGRERETG